MSDDVSARPERHVHAVREKVDRVGAPAAAEGPRKSRGLFFEMTFDPGWSGPTEPIDLTDVQRSTHHERKRVNITGETIHLHGVSLKECDLSGLLKRSSFTSCEFIHCRFVGSSWETVKFSNCTFDHCHLAKATFSGCKFLQTCKYAHISASGEELIISKTSISPSAFLSSIETNLLYLDHAPAKNRPWTTEEYQKYRHSRTRSKIAKMIFASTRDEADPELYFDAQKQLTLAHGIWRASEPRYLNEGHGSPPIKRNRLGFWMRSMPRRAELGVSWVAGVLTDWGQSLVRAFLALGVLIASFTLVYALDQPSPSESSLTQVISGALLQSIDISLVFGYSKYEFGTTSQKWTSLPNVVLGLYWYSIVVPVIIRRFLR